MPFYRFADSPRRGRSSRHEVHWTHYLDLARPFTNIMPMCINQVDEEEKSWQVSLMRDIYKGAAVVMVWLGPSADDSDLAMDTINAIGSRALNWRVQDRYVVGNWM